MMASWTCLADAHPQTASRWCDGPTRPRAVRQARYEEGRIVASITCLIGNGLSIAYNEELSMEKLTLKLLDEFSELSGSAAARSLKMFASELSGSSKEPNFEDLLGPLDSASRAIPYLSGMGTLFRGSERPFRQCIGKVSQHAKEAHRLGLGVVLDRIATCGQGQSGLLEKTILRVLTKLVRAPRLDGCVLTIATLNYDGLLQAGLMRLKEEEDLYFSDLGDGRPEAQEHVQVSASVSLEASRIRALDDLPYGVQLIHLHGSLGWLSCPGKDSIWKFPIPDLRRMSYWTEFKNGKASMTPQVVLTDQKTSVITERPFSLAYSIFQDRLQSSDFWFIGGYGFGDQPVNTVLEQAYRSRLHQDNLPRILMIDPTTRIREKALSIFPAYQDHPTLFEYCAATLPEAVDIAKFDDFFGYCRSPF